MREYQTPVKLSCEQCILCNELFILLGRLYNNMKKAILIIFLVFAIILIALFVLPGRGKYPPYPLLHTDLSKSNLYDYLSKDELIKDIDHYIGIIKTAHGDPFHSISEQAFNEKAEELKKRIRKEVGERIQLIDGYYYLQELAAAIQDEHTEISFNKEWQKSILNWFPLKVEIIDEKFYVIENHGKNDIPRYAEILSINGKPLQEMTAEIMKYQNNTLHHYKMQSVQENFDIWLQIYFRMESPWVIEYSYHNRVDTIEIPGMSYEEYKEKNQQDYQYSESSFIVDGETVPLLELPKFWYEDKKAYEKFIDDFFNSHKEKKNLVIDLRRNPGGDGRWGFFVLDYLTDSPYKTQERFAYKVSEPYKKIVRWMVHLFYYEKKIPRVLWWIPFYKFMEYYFKDEAVNILSGKMGTFVEAKNVLRDPGNKKTKFKGNVYLLTSHYTNSAAVVFAAIFKYHKMGTIIGQETGGREAFCSDPILVELPNSKLRAKIPVAIYVLPGNNPHRGVLPDINVEYSVEDYINKRDKELEKVKELILIEKSKENKILNDGAF